MRALKLLSLAAGLVVAESHARALDIQVSQESAPGAGDFDSNVLGVVTPVVTPLPLAQYYVPGQSFQAASPTTTPDASHAFVVQAADGLFFVVVHDKVGSGTSGYAEMRFDLAGDTDGAAFAVQDDTNDQYEGAPGAIAFASGNTWSGCCTDGLALGILNGGWSMTFRFTNVAEFNTANPNTYIVGLTHWLALSGDGSSIDLTIQKDRRVRFAAAAPTTTVTRSTVGLLPIQLSPPLTQSTSTARAISSTGLVVGEITLEGETPQAFVWSPETGTTTLGTLGGTYSTAIAVTDQNLVIGESLTATGELRTFTWTPTTGMTEVPALPEGFHPVDTNTLGDVVGWVDDAGGRTGYFFNDTVGLIDLGGLGGGSTTPAAISNSGIVVGGSASAGGESHAFMWTASGGMFDLGGELGLTNSQAQDVNDLGQIAILTHDFHSYFFGEEGLFDLGSLGSVPVVTIARTINNRGEVAGESLTASGEQHSFLWTRQGGMADLNAQGTQTSGALSISASGQILAYNTLSSGEVQTVLWQDHTQTGYTVTRLAQGTAVGGELQEAPAINDSGVVAYIAYHGGTTWTVEKTDGFSTQVVATNGDIFQAFSRVAINGPGAVAYSGPYGVFRAIGVNDPATGTRVLSLSEGIDTEVSLNDLGDVTFSDHYEDIVNGEVRVLERVWVAHPDNSLDIVDCTGSSSCASVPSHLGRAFLGAADINNLGEVAYWKVVAPSTAEEGIALSTLEGTPLVRAEGTGFFVFSRAHGLKGHLAVNDIGFVAFFAGLDTQSYNNKYTRAGIFGRARDGGIYGTIYDFADSFDGYGFPFEPGVCVNNASHVAFLANRAEGRGVFTGADPVLDKVIQVGDALDGSTVTDVRFGPGGLNNKGAIAFIATLADGRTGLYRAEPPVGSLPENPQLPVLGDPGGPYEFTWFVGMNDSDRPVYYDPVVAEGYDFAVGAGSPRIASVILPANIGDDRYDLWLWDGGAWVDSGVDLVGGVPYPFPPGGVDRFRILGIETDALVDPANPLAFPTGLTFSAPGTVELTMTPLSVQANGPPAADAGPDQTVEASGPLTAVVLDGSGSSDPDGDPLTYSWTWPGGTAEGVSPTVSLPLGDTFITLVVSDGSTPSLPSTVLVHVEDTTPAAPDVDPLSTAAGECAVTLSPPTATDLVDGAVTGTTEALTITTLGPSSVTWTYTDAAGNPSTQAQDVFVYVVPTGLEPPLAALVPEGETPPLPVHSFNGNKLPLKLALSCSGVAPPRLVELFRTDTGAEVDLGAGLDFAPTISGGWSLSLSVRDLAATTYWLIIELPDTRRFVGAFELR